MTRDEEARFKQVLEEGARLQQHLPWLQMVMVGGSAAALHAAHRYSTDTDHVTHLLREQFALVAEALEDWEGWTTNRVNRPVLILGERHDVQMGVRQSRRTVPYETMRAAGMWVPTPAEMLRIKAFLLTERKATRDYLDVAALTDLLGDEASAEALSYLNLLYDPVGNQTRLTKFAEACQQQPLDLDEVDLDSYRGIVAPYNRWEHVSARCRDLARRVFLREMDDALPRNLDEFPGVQPQRDEQDGPQGARDAGTP